jgi:hypothetical protein
VSNLLALLNIIGRILFKVSNWFSSNWWWNTNRNIHNIYHSYSAVCTCPRSRPYHIFLWSLWWPFRFDPDCHLLILSFQHVF